MTMTRKEFLRSVVGAGVGAVGVAALVGCGGDDGGGSVDAPAAACTTPTSAIGTNHGHTITVSLTDVNAAADKTYDITGSSPHAHSVTVTAAQFAQIKGGTTLMITSTSGAGHTHAVTVMCVS
jgi:hypothetical protein